MSRKDYLYKTRTTCANWVRGTTYKTMVFIGSQRATPTDALDERFSLIVPLRFVPLIPFID
jgi:hypothetical protein